MVKITIACLIYKSIRWLDFVYEQIKKHTDLENNEFYFVANDATPEVLLYLEQNNIPHYIHTNTEEQKKEWYINNVYRAYNTAGRMAKGEYVVFINSDMAFSPHWLDDLMDSMNNNICVCSRLVERGIMRSGKYGIEINFGKNPSDYNENQFLNYIKNIKKPILYYGGLYMPILLKKQHLEQVGYYPEGNIIPGSDIFNPSYAKLGENCISGDAVFIQKLETIGIKQYTNFNSIVYHFQGGETNEE